MRYILLFTLFNCCSLALVFSQENRPYRNFATQKVNQELRKQYAEMIEAQSEIANYFHNFKQRGQIRPKLIPIVFHVVYNSEEERVSLDQVYSQIEALNRDFNHEITSIGHPAERFEDFPNKKPNRIDINFCLADIKIKGNKSSGLEYISTSVEQFGTDNRIKSKKTGGTDAYQSDRYLNVWIGKLQDDVSGYAQMPGGPKETDGIVIDYRFFGIGGTAISPYDEGKTLTHLVGNYLGLMDLWNETVPCGDDGIWDTPVHNGPNFGCPGYKHISFCDGNPTEMTMNFMDNTDDACMYMFTYGQMIRMHAALSPKGPRHKLTTGASKCQVGRDLALSFQDTPSNSSSSMLQQFPSVSISPNPAQNQVQLNMENYDGEVEVSVYSTLGNLVLQNTYLSPSFTLNCEKWQAGVYMIHLKANDHQLTHRLVVTH